MSLHSRRSFLASLAAVSTPAWLAGYRQLAAADRNKVKITGIKTMMLQGPRSYTLVKVETDAGVYGVAEAYGSPGLGVREAIAGLREAYVGEDPLGIDRLYTNYRYTDGSAHAQQRAMSGIEMALWDLAGKLLNVPTHVLLGGKFRDRVRLYDHSHPTDFFDKAACRDWAQEVKERPNGINMHKFAPLRNEAGADPGRDPANRMLSGAELRRIRQGYEICRDALGFEHDILIGCHWEFDRDRFRRGPR
jgi:L-alanine-DL-glutamate epimerase-like enolase superfamily enzyme